MVELVQRLVTENSFDDTGTFREVGMIGAFKPENANEDHQKTLDGYVPPVVEMAAVGPTGPNPTAPQQIPPDGFQTAGGGYAQPGKVLVGEVTKQAEDRLAGITSPEDEAKATEQLKEALLEDSKSAELVQGTVPEIAATLGGKTDEELAAMKAQEIDNERPRKGVLAAIDAELEARAAQ
jgi:hypothetical protein